MSKLRPRELKPLSQGHTVLPVTYSKCLESKGPKKQLWGEQYAGHLLCGEPESEDGATYPSLLTTPREAGPTLLSVCQSHFRDE